MDDAAVSMIQDLVVNIRSMEHRMLVISSEYHVTLAKLHDLERDLVSLADIAQGFVDLAAEPEVTA